MPYAHVANEDLLVNFLNTGGPPDIVYVGDQGLDPVKIISIKSVSCFTPSKAVCTDSIGLTFTAVNVCPHTSATHTFVSGGGVINATSVKAYANNMKVLRQDDSGTCVGVWQPPGAPPPPTIPCGCNIKIGSAGQVKVLAQ